MYKKKKKIQHKNRENPLVTSGVLSRKRDGGGGRRGDGKTDRIGGHRANGEIITYYVTGSVDGGRGRSVVGRFFWSVGPGRKTRG